MKEPSAIVEAEIEHLRRENRELKICMSSYLAHAGRFHSDLVYALTGHREHCSDAQVIATAKATRLDALAFWKRSEN